MNGRSRHLVVLWLPVFAWCGLIFWLSSIPHLQTNLGIWDLILRKAAHLMEYGVLALLTARALSGSTRWSRGRVLFWAALCSCLYAFSDEWHQAFVPGRGPSFGDIGIDSTGALLALFGIGTRS
ncbi:MAG: VanZ family protein [Elusimicrobia bacterium]|nr:VanZ family protein [Elusimicrobiota bacterium]